eukprot:scaffold1483_cov379-Prasinococcus_capsulatus_cf.AAC.8
MIGLLGTGIALWPSFRRSCSGRYLVDFVQSFQYLREGRACFRLDVYTVVDQCLGLTNNVRERQAKRYDVH